MIENYSAECYSLSGRLPDGTSGPSRKGGARDMTAGAGRNAAAKPVYHLVTGTASYQGDAKVPADDPVAARRDIYAGLKAGVATGEFRAGPTSGGLEDITGQTGDGNGEGMADAGASSDTASSTGLGKFVGEMEETSFRSRFWRCSQGSRQRLPPRHDGRRPDAVALERNLRPVGRNGRRRSAQWTTG
jgi:hypothetical protein